MRRAPRRSIAAALVLLVACTSEPDPQIELAEVTAGEVVETVAAPARLAPEASAQLLAPAAAEVAELLVEDGDRVTAGDPVVRLASEEVEARLDQAAAAVEAVRAVDAADATGADPSGAFGALRTQLDATVPPLVDAVELQLDATSSAVEAADGLLAEARELAGQLERLRSVARPEHGGRTPPGIELPETPVALPEPDTDRLEAAARELEDTGARLERARGQVTAIRRSSAEASAQLREAERAAATQAEQLERARAEQVAAQVEQAQATLEAVQARQEALTVRAPISGVVELARSGGGEAGLPALPDLGDLGQLQGPGDGTPGAAPGGPREGALEVGVRVGAGELLATVYDLSGFEAVASVDELDVVRVEEGQPVDVLLEALPGSEVSGTVTHVALAAGRDGGGGTSFEVVVELGGLPDDVPARVGLTATAEIEVRRVRADTVVPTSALLRRGEDEVVHVVRDGTAREVPVTVLAMGDRTAAVEGALETGESVVTVGVELVDDGDDVPT